MVAISMGALRGHTMFKNSFHIEFSVCPNLTALNIFFLPVFHCWSNECYQFNYFIYTTLIALLILPIQVSTFFLVPVLPCSF